MSKVLAVLFYPTRKKTRLYNENNHINDWVLGGGMGI